MTDPLRSDRQTSGNVPDRDRDARIEELLVTGLDHYFADQHEQAINVWTRVLFIDRGHARARAYIERARGAIAERHRMGEELLHTGVAAFDRGDAGTARELLASAVEHGASGDEVMAVLARIERLEGAATPHWLPAPAVPGPNQARALVDSAGRRNRLKWILTGVAAGTFLGAAVLTVLVQRGVITWPVAPRSTAVPVSPLSSTLPVPSIAELAFTRAQSLYARGRLYDALAALEPIDHGDRLRPQADELKTLIQRQLLGLPRETQQEGGPRRP